MKAFYFLLFCLCFHSCVTTKEILKKYPVESGQIIDKTEFTFQNKTISSEKFEESLIAVLEQRYVFRYKKEISNWKELNVKINIQNNRLIVDGYYKDSLVYHKNYKGEVKENYFDIKRKTRYFGVPFFLVFNDSKIILSIDENENLILSQANYSAGWIIMGANFVDYRNYKYQKIK